MASIGVAGKHWGIRRTFTRHVAGNGVALGLAHHTHSHGPHGQISWLLTSCIRKPQVSHCIGNGCRAKVSYQVA